MDSLLMQESTPYEDNLIKIHIRPVKYQDPLTHFLSRVEGETVADLRVIVTSPYGSKFRSPSTTLFESIGSAQFKEIKWYFESYPVLNSFNRSRATAVENALHRHGSQLLKDFFPSEILPKNVKHSNIIVQVSLGSAQDDDANQLSRFFWEVLEDKSIWQETLGLFPQAVTVVRMQQPSRHLALSRSEKTSMRKSSKMLVVTARLSGDEDIPYKLITRAIYNVAARQAASEPAIDVKMVRPGTFEALQTTLRSHECGYFDILHLDMHGTLDQNGRAVLFFMKIDQNLRIRPDPVDVNSLAEVLVEFGVETVVINSCRSAANDGSASNLTRSLVDAGVSAAIGMQFNILSRSAEIFVRSFYQNLLLHGASLVVAMSSARRELLLNCSRGTRFGVGISLRDFLIPVLHISTNISDSLLQEQEAKISRIHTLRLAEESSSIMEVVGRENDLLLLEAAISQLFTPCINLFGQTGVGKTAFLVELKDWWSMTGFMSHQIWIGLNEYPTSISSAEYLLDTIEKRVKKIRTECQMRSSTTHICGHKILTVIEDIEAPWIETSPSFSAFQRALKLLIRRSSNVIWLISSGICLSWLSSVAVPYELKPLKFATALSLASSLITSQENVEHPLKVRSARNYFEEMILFCSGNPLAIKILTAHINNQIQRDKPCSMKSIFDTFLNYGGLDVGKDFVFGLTNGHQVRALYQLLHVDIGQTLHENSNRSCPVSPKSRRSSFSNDNVHDLLSGTPKKRQTLEKQPENSRTKSIRRHSYPALVSVDTVSYDRLLTVDKVTVVLALGSFLSSMPFELEAFLTTLYVLQTINCLDQTEIPSDIYQILSAAIHQGAESRRNVRSHLYQILSTNHFTRFAGEMLQGAINIELWVSKLLDQDLMSWISPPYCKIYGGDDWKYQDYKRTIHPVFTLILRTSLAHQSIGSDLLDDIQFSHAAEIRYTVGWWSYLIKDEPVRSSRRAAMKEAIGIQFDSEYLNLLNHISCIQKEGGWPDHQDWVIMTDATSYSNASERRTSILADSCEQFSRFAIEYLQHKKDLLLPQGWRDETEKHLKALSEADPWLVHLEWLGLLCIRFVISSHMTYFQPFSHIRDILDILQDKSLIEHQQDMNSKHVWHMNLKFLNRYLDVFDGRRDLNIAEELDMVREFANLSEVSHDQVIDFQKVDTTATLEDQLLDVLGDNQDLLDSGNETMSKLMSILIRTVKSIESGVLSEENTRVALTEMENLLEQEVQISNNPAVKANLYRVLAGWSVVLQNPGIIADHRQREDDLLSSLDPHMVSFHKAQNKLAISLLQQSSGEQSSTTNSEEEQLVEQLAGEAEKLDLLQNGSTHDTALKIELKENLGQISYNLCKWQDAIKYWLDVLKLRWANDEFHSREIYSITEKLARAYGHDRQHQESIKCFRILLQHTKNDLDSDEGNAQELKVRRLLGMQLAAWFADSGDKTILTEAEKELKLAYEGNKNRKVTYDSQGDLALASWALGDFYLDIKDYKNAEQYLQKSVLLARGLEVDPTKDYCTLFQRGLARVYDESGRSDLAEQLCLDIKDRRSTILGPNHEDTLQSIADVGSLLEKNGKIAEAQSLARQHLTALVAAEKLYLVYSDQALGFSFGNCNLGPLGYENILDENVRTAAEAFLGISQAEDAGSTLWQSLKQWITSAELAVVQYLAFWIRKGWAILQGTSL